MSRVCIPAASIAAAASDRRLGYTEAVIAAATKEGELLCLERADFDRIRADYAIRGLGDRIERNPVVKAVARVLGLPCYGPDGRLKPESGCGKRRDLANRLFPEKPPAPPERQI